ncbi:hypothetical protein CANARDRAFT_7914 [[Candida] arabinofermentans NRRL YB-2248]|uniref:Translocon Sec61/SecY plug domain-containing protein n=1 Tax=[Candida] arabinofermentans NRRL YB-2248 TaxID=983967 RepID=A0A1E4T0P2_9ASCO|nr:hypothetical protein CANARDRAFT_7914 [[Candida] arabinofermentans NRRL YB-2248]
MSGIRLLDLAKPFVGLLPEIELPYQSADFDEKIVYTIAAAALYSLCGLPLNNVNIEKIADPFTWLRSPLASQSGTLLEFGVLPIVTAGFLWQIIAGFRLIKVNFESRSDRELFQSLQKITAVVLALIYSVLLCFAGYFDSIDGFTNDITPSPWPKLTIVLQLTGMSLITSLFVELLDKNYGFGPGALVLIGTSAATQLSSSIIGFTSEKTSRGYESHGALIQLIKNIRNKPLGTAIYDAFTRENFGNLTQIYIVFAALSAVLYLGNMRIELPIKSAKVRAMSSVYPVKLLYCGALPLLFTYTVLYNANIFGFCFTQIFKDSKYISLLGKWELNDFSLKTYDLTSGFLYFISISNKSSNVLYSLIRPITFSIFITLTSYFFAKNWANVSGSAGKDLAKQFKEQEIALVGHRDVGAAKELNKVIPVASVTGSFLISSIAIGAESLGFCKGLGAGCIIGLMSSLTCLETIMTEWQQNNGAASQFGKVFGGQQ